MGSLLAQAGPLFDWLVRSTIQASVLILLILAFRLATRGRLRARWHYLLWLLVVVRMLLPWAPESGLSLFNWAPSSQEDVLRALGWPRLPEGFGGSTLDLLRGRASDRVVGADVAAEAVGQGVSGREAIRARSVSVRDALSMIWLAGVGVLSVSALGAGLAFWAKVRRATAVTDRAALELLGACSLRMGIARPPKLAQTDTVRSPSLFGLFRPCLLLPAGMVGTFSHEQLRHIFLHELAHMKRRDIPVGLLATVLQIVHWFNPLVWVAFHRMRADRELACDAMALSRLEHSSSRQYAETILALLEAYSPPTPAPAIVGMLAGRSQLLRRMVMITRFKKSSYRRTVLGAALLVVLACVALTNAQSGSAARAGKKDIKAVIAKLDLRTAKLPDVIRVLGKPEKYWGKDETYDEKALPDCYFASYPNGITVFMTPGGIEGIRFEKPGYVLHGAAEVGARVDEALKPLGKADKTVQGKDGGWQDGAKHIDGYYYARPDGPFRVMASKGKIIAIDMLRGSPAVREKVTLGPDSKIDENGRIVDKIDYPFVDDPEAIGQWETVDLVRRIEDFDPKVRSWKGKDFLKGLVLVEDGGSLMPAATWTKGLVLYRGERTASKYQIKQIDGTTYMFLECKSGDYIIRHRKPWYRVLKKLPPGSQRFKTAADLYAIRDEDKVKLGPDSKIDANGQIVDKVDYGFVNDPRAIGRWRTVDFVDRITDFDPQSRRCKGDLCLKECVFLTNGQTRSTRQRQGDVEVTRHDSWTKGMVLDKSSRTASKYHIKEIGGATYMFQEWKSGDYTQLHRRPSYYVLKKVSWDAGPIE